MRRRINISGALRGWIPRTAVLSFFAFALLSAAWAADAQPSTPVLVELFTSEGCSSCPPADAFLRNLDAQQPLDGARLIVLEEHVDYWDDQGWKDRFSSHEVTLRQQGYAQRLRLQGPYTPQMVVDGAYEFVGNDPKKADEAFEKSRELPSVPVRISAAGADKGKVQAHIECDAVPGKADVFAALALEQADTQVKAGENGGRHLEHVAILKEIRKIGNTGNGRAFAKDLTLDPPARQQPWRLVVFLQEPGQGKVIGAALQRIQP